MGTDDLLKQLAEGTLLEGPHWPEPVTILTAKARGTRIEMRAVGLLAGEGADIVCQVVIIAKGESAIRENTVELGIKESLSQRGINADIQTG